MNTRLAELIYELSSLEYTVRAGWARLGIPPSIQETVADHSFGSSIIAIILAVIDGTVDVGKVATLALLHDAAETRTGDMTPPLLEILDDIGVSRRRIEERAEELQRHGLPEDIQDLFRKTLEEYRAKETPEAKIASDAQLIDMGIQAIRYMSQGYTTTEFVGEIASRLQTDVGRELWSLIRENLKMSGDWFSRRP